MITLADVTQTMQTADPDTTPEQARQLHETIVLSLQEREDELTHLLRQRWVAHNGRQPDGLTWGRILDQAKHEAENQIRQEYLAPLTEQVVQNQLDDPQDNPHLRALNDPNGWRTHPEDIQPSRETVELVETLWEDQPAKFQIFAEALIERMTWTGQPLPTTPEHPDYQPTTLRIQDAHDAAAKNWETIRQGVEQRQVARREREQQMSDYARRWLPHP